jgi:malonyl-CoA/methylmalonyl-CoA synthetase
MSERADGSSRLLGHWRSLESDERPAIWEGDVSTSYAELAARADRVAAALLGGSRSLDGERVAVLTSPGADFAASFFGILRAGGVVVVLSPLHPAPETRYFCDDAHVRRVIAASELRSHVSFLAPERELLDPAALVEASRARIVAEPTDSDPALQLYTSGTTGKPKGAVITHGNLATQQSLLRDAWGWNADDVLLHMLPLHHMHGLAIAWLSAVGAGATTRFLRGFDARLAWESMARASVLMAVPTIHRKLFDAFDAGAEGARRAWAKHARGLRLVTSGSAALPVRVGQRWVDVTGAYPLERFGMTEIGVGTTNPLDASKRRPGTVGVPLPSVETRIVDDELWVAGPSVFAGYHHHPEATHESFVHEGGTRWFRTGDTVSRDDDGYVRILGRTSVDILKSGGYKLSALEIEEVLREHPGVADVAVVGLPDETWGERVVACVIARKEVSPSCSSDSVRAFARERLAPYKVPREVVVMDELPRNAIGKVQKPSLTKLLLGRPPG